MSEKRTDCEWVIVFKWDDPPRGVDTRNALYHSAYEGILAIEKIAKAINDGLKVVCVNDADGAQIWNIEARRQIYLTRYWDYKGATNEPE